MTAQSPLDDPAQSLGQEVDQLCDAFEAAWKRGSPLSIERLLEGAPRSRHATLLRELLHLDLEYRRRRHERPQPGAYAARFPRHVGIVAEVFREIAPNGNEAAAALQPETCDAVDENLLFGILALQMDFVSREQYVVAMLLWVRDKSRSLQQIFREQGVLQKDTIQLLTALVAKHFAIRTKSAE